MRRLIYDPPKPDRPLQVIHVDETSGTRLMLQAEVEAGKRNDSMNALRELDDCWTGCGRRCHGDRDYGTERVIALLEELGLPVQADDEAQRQGTGAEAGRAGGVSAEEEGGGPAAASAVHAGAVAQGAAEQAAGAAVHQGGRGREAAPGILGAGHLAGVGGPALARLFRDRADAGNAFEELKKNQWGWGEFRDAGPEAHAHHGAPERAVLRLVVAVRVNDRSGIAA